VSVLFAEHSARRQYHPVCSKWRAPAAEWQRVEQEHQLRWIAANADANLTSGRALTRPEYTTRTGSDQHRIVQGKTRSGKLRLYRNGAVVVRGNFAGRQVRPIWLAISRDLATIQDHEQSSDRYRAITFEPPRVCRGSNSERMGAAMSKTTKKFSPEVRERAVRMVVEHEDEYPLVGRPWFRSRRRSAAPHTCCLSG
jgi:hypothetical protein